MVSQRAFGFDGHGRGQCLLIGMSGCAHGQRRERTIAHRLASPRSSSCSPRCTTPSKPTIPDGFEHLPRPLHPALSQPVIAGVRRLTGPGRTRLAGPPEPAGLVAHRHQRVLALSAAAAGRRGCGPPRTALTTNTRTASKLRGLPAGALCLLFEALSGVARWVGLRSTPSKATFTWTRDDGREFVRCGAVAEDWSGPAVLRRGGVLGLGGCRGLAPDAFAEDDDHHRQCRRDDQGRSDEEGVPRSRQRDHRAR